MSYYFETEPYYEDENNNTNTVYPSKGRFQTERPSPMKLIPESVLNLKTPTKNESTTPI